MIKLFSREKKVSILTPLEGYNRWAVSYQQEDNPIKNLSDSIVERWLPPLSKKKFLDAGCGAGKFCVLAQKKEASEIHGLDLSPAMIEMAKTHCPSGSFQCGDLTQLKLPTNHFDVIVCALVLGHIENLDVALGALLSALKDEGTIIITDFHPFLTLQNSKRTFNDKKTGTTFEVQHHLHLFQEYFRILRAHQLIIDQFEEPFFQNVPVVFGIRAQKFKSR